MKRNLDILTERVFPEVILYSKSHPIESVW